MTRREPWMVAAAIAVLIGVMFSVLLMSVAEGVKRDVNKYLVPDSAPTSNQHGPPPPVVTDDNIDRIKGILDILTAVVTTAMLCQTAAATFALGVTVMRSRREEIALRRQSGVFRSRLLLEFLEGMFWPCLVGGLVGECLGVIAAVIVSKSTVLHAHFTPGSVLSAFPVTVVLALAATFLPAWRAANASPAMLRRE